MFDYFKPPELPTFDSKANTISAEVRLFAAFCLAFGDKLNGQISWCGQCPKEKEEERNAYSLSSAEGLPLGISNKK